MLAPTPCIIGVLKNKVNKKNTEHAEILNSWCSILNVEISRKSGLVVTKTNLCVIKITQ